MLAFVSLGICLAEDSVLPEGFFWWQIGRIMVSDNASRKKNREIQPSSESLMLANIVISELINVHGSKD